MMWGHGWDMGWWWLFGLLILVGIALLVAFIVLAVRMSGGGKGQDQRHGSTGPAPGPSRARQILDERYASGELTTEQYREQIEVLGENR